MIWFHSRRSAGRMNNVAPEIFSRLAHRSSNCALLCVFFRLRARDCSPSDTKQALELCGQADGPVEIRSNGRRVGKNDTANFCLRSSMEKRSEVDRLQGRGEGEMLGPNVRFKISLKYIGKNGTSEERSYNYLVTKTLPSRFSVKKAN